MREEIRVRCPACRAAVGQMCIAYIHAASTVNPRLKPPVKIHKQRVTLYRRKYGSQCQ